MMAVAACASGTPPPETSPLAETGVVGGRVEMSIVPGAAVPSVLVSVAGADVTANVSRLGDFVIANVPAGPLELRFTGAGIAATLPAGSLAAGETLTMTVRLTPAQAAIDSMSRVRGTAALVEGVIAESDVALPAGAIVVGGRIVRVPSGVTATGGVNGTTPALKPGLRVRVTGTLDAAGITAREITIL